MDPPGLVVDIELLRQAQSFANSIISAALQSLNDYEYITGAIHVDNIDSKLHRKLVASCLTLSAAMLFNIIL